MAPKRGPKPTIKSAVLLQAMVPKSMRRAVDGYARRKGINRSEAVRLLLTDALAMRDETTAASE